MSKLNRNQKAMLFAEGIVERYRARGNQLPHRSKTCRMDPDREQEYKDAAKLNDWKQSLKGNRGTCSPEIRNYLDLHIPRWCEVLRTNKVSTNSSQEVISNTDDHVHQDQQNQQDHSSSILATETLSDIVNVTVPNTLDNTLPFLTLNIKTIPIPDAMHVIDDTTPTRTVTTDTVTYSTTSVNNSGNICSNTDTGTGTVIKPDIISTCSKNIASFKSVPPLSTSNTTASTPSAVTATTTTNANNNNTSNNSNITLPDSYSSMQKAQAIVQRYILRGNILPRELRDHQHDPTREQEYRDAQKLNKWKQALSGKTGHACCDELRDYLDVSMPSWRVELRKNYSNPLLKARDIVARYKSRGKILPRQFRSGNDPLRQQENKDARKLYDWKQALKGLRFYKCSDELRDYLDTEMSGWRQNLKEVHTNPMQKAIDIVERYHLNGCLLPRQYKNGTDMQRIQENKDAQKLYNWKEALNGKRGKCSDAIRDYLDVEIHGWRAETHAVHNSNSNNSSSSSSSSINSATSGSGSGSSGVTDGECQTDSVMGGDHYYTGMTMNPTTVDMTINKNMNMNVMCEEKEKHDGKRKRYFETGITCANGSADEKVVACGQQQQQQEEEEEEEEEDYESAARISKQLKIDSELLLHLNHGNNGTKHGCGVYSSPCGLNSTTIF